MSVQIEGQSASNIAAPLFRRVSQISNDGDFEVEFDMPFQGRSIVPVSQQGNARYFAVYLELDGKEVPDREEGQPLLSFREGENVKVRFRYTHNGVARLLGCVVDGDGNRSDMVDYPYGISFSASGFVVDFEACGNAVMSDCVIEGGYGGIVARSDGGKPATVQLLDCEIILESGATAFVVTDSPGTMYKQNVREITR